MAGKYQKIGEASFWGCITVIRGEAEKRQDPMMMLIGQNYCVSVAKQVIEQTLNSGPCSENDRECHFLSGCVKAKVALSESSILTTSKKQEAELARSCDTAFVLYQEAEEKDKAVKNGE